MAPRQRINAEAQLLVGDLIEGIVALIPLVRGRVEDFRIGCGDILIGEMPL